MGQRFVYLLGCCCVALVCAKGKEYFLHVFAYLVEGRSTEQKAALSRAVIGRLNDMLPTLSILSMNVSEFQKAT